MATILCYHEVDPPAAMHVTVPRRSATAGAADEMLRYTVTPENFEAQLDYLVQHGYHVIPLAELVEFLDGERDALPPRAVVITVDDGWLCAATRIAPELRKRGMPFTLFVYPQIVDDHGAHALSWAQVEQIAAEGGDVEGHTYTHPFLTEIAPQLLDHELDESKKEIERHTGRPVQFLSYPYGDYDAAIVARAAGSGYRAAVTTRRAPVTRSTPPMQLPRYLVHDDTTLEEFKTFLLP